VVDAVDVSVEIPLSEGIELNGSMFSNDDNEHILGAEMVQEQVSHFAYFYIFVCITMLFSHTFTHYVLQLIYLSHLNLRSKRKSSNESKNKSKR
jgi:hypothetical protein